MTIIAEDPIHLWFGLTYSSYLVLPRTALQTMPREWQQRFVDMLEELRGTIDFPEQPSGYRVLAVDDRGKFVEDPMRNYRRGRARAPLRGSLT